MSKLHVIALVGNPNVGKTTLFNALTGARQTVGNWPGVTVEHKSGYFYHEQQKLELIDLPGIYSLSASSPDEQVSRDFIIHQKPDLIINIVDASNLERNLYLTTQLMEMRVPMMIVFSMTDIAEQNGIEIDYAHLVSHLGFDAIPLQLNKKHDLEQLIGRIQENLHREVPIVEIKYDEIVEKELSAIEEHLKQSGEPEISSYRWTALKLIEEDAQVKQRIDPACYEEISQHIRSVSKHRRQPGPAVIADDRYGFIRGLVKDVVQRKRKSPYTFSDRVDQVVLNKFLGMPIFFFVMYLVFLVAVRFSQPFVSLIDTGFSWLFVEQFGQLLGSLKFPAWLGFILTEGLGGGITTIGTFIPPIFFIYISLSVLEDSGYMARAAFLSDKFMRKVGLPGKAFIPLLVGFGCTVPAIMATRTLESKRDRVFASLLAPFMSCGAKLPVYTFLGMMFFAQRADLLIFGLYLGGVVMAMVTGLLLRKTIFKTDPGNFVMELPPYHVPTFNAIFLHTWHRLKDFVLRAGKTILMVILFINILQLIYVPSPFRTDDGKPQKETVLQIGGKVITPLLHPMGIKKDNWQASVALISGLFAKEAIVGSLQSLYQNDSDEVELEKTIANSFGSLGAILAYLFFVMLYSPCAAALAMLWKEHGAGWMAFSFGYLTVLAWAVATLIYQLTNWNSESLLWIGVILALGMGFYQLLRIFGKKDINVIKA